MLFLLRFLSFRYWLRHRGALGLAMLGVAMGVAVFVAVQVANFSVLSAFQTSLEAVTGRSSLQIVGGARGLPESVYTNLVTRPDARIQSLAPTLERTLFSPTLKANAREDGTSLLVLGVDLFAQADFFDLDLQSDWDASASTSGVSASTSKPQIAANLNARGETDNSSNDSRALLGRWLLDARAMAVSRAVAEKFGLKPGSPIDLFVGAKRERFHVVAVLGAKGFDRAFGGDFAVVDIASAQEVFGSVGRLSQIDLIVPDAQIEGVTRDLRARIGRDLPFDARVQRPARRSSQVGELLAAFQLNLSALSCITLFVGAFLIYNTVAVAVVRRRSEAGILRAVGTPSLALTRLFMIEAGIIGLIGSLIGVALGLVLARYTLQEVSRTVSTLYVAVKAREIVMPMWLWWGAPLGGTVLSMLAALPAAMEAGRVSPRQALNRATLHSSTTEFARPLAWLGVAIIGFGFVISLPFVSRIGAWIGFVATSCTLGGFALMAPALVLKCGRGVQVLGVRFGPIWLLAGTYLQRAIHRSGLIVAALMVSLAMTIGLSIMVTSFRGTVADWIDNTISADLFVAPARGFGENNGPGLPPEVGRYARTLPQLRVMDTIRGAQTVIDNQPVFIAANTLPALQSGDRRLRWVQTRGSNQAAQDDFLASRAVLISERFSNLLHIRAGQNVSLITPKGQRTYPVAGVFYDYTPNEAVIYLPQRLYQRDWNDFAIDGLALYFEPNTDVNAVMRDFQARFGRQFQLTLLPNAQIRQSVFQTFDDTFAVTYALQLIAVIVAAVGIFDTLLALLLERGRELAMLRATGASSAQIRSSTLLEFALIGFFSWLLAMPAGIVLAGQLIWNINRQFFGWTIQPTLPAGVWIQALVLALGAAIGAGVLPSRAAARADIARALQSE